MSTHSLVEWPVVDSSELEAEERIKKNQRSILSDLLPSPIYWWRFPGGRKIFWNKRLIRDYLRNGPGPAHDRLVEQYLATLDSAA